jgi:hypothetical protein
MTPVESKMQAAPPPATATQIAVIYSAGTNVAAEKCL